MAPLSLARLRFPELGNARALEWRRPSEHAPAQPTICRHLRRRPLEQGISDRKVVDHQAAHDEAGQYNRQQSRKNLVQIPRLYCKRSGQVSRISAAYLETMQIEDPEDCARRATAPARVDRCRCPTSLLSIDPVL